LTGQHIHRSLCLLYPHVLPKTSPDQKPQVLPAFELPRRLRWHRGYRQKKRGKGRITLRTVEFRRPHPDDLYLLRANANGLTEDTRVRMKITDPSLAPQHGDGLADALLIRCEPAAQGRPQTENVEVIRRCVFEDPALNAAIQAARG